MSQVAAKSVPATKTVPVMLTGGRVMSTFRDALFAAASREGRSVNEFVLRAAAEKISSGGDRFPGVFAPGDLCER
jgi:uncharacterized protein (DUF1778 family)